jgi:hypothetical protein
MTAPEQIKVIEYKWGMYDQSTGYDQGALLNELMLEGSEIPSEILEALEYEGILDLEGDYGDPKLGDPVEVDQLRIDRERGSLEIRVFNRGILLFLTDDERMRRLHRFLGKLKRTGMDEA